MNEILASVISAVAVIVAAIIGIAWRRSGRSSAPVDQSISPFPESCDLKGFYRGEWYLYDPNGGERLYVVDGIEITKHTTLTIDGRGADKRGRYEIEGKCRPYSLITFVYRSEGKPDALLGGGILRPDARFEVLSGTWCGHIDGERIVCGRLVWTSVTKTEYQKLCRNHPDQLA